MLYQLPSGKIVHLSLEEFLGMNDQEFHNIVNSGYGEEPHFNSYFNTKGKIEKKVKPEEDDTPDYEPDL